MSDYNFWQRQAQSVKTLLNKLGTKQPNAISIFVLFWSVLYRHCTLLAKIHTVSSISSSPSFFTWKGHQPLTRLCLKSDICGTLPSCFSIPRVHCLEVLAPLGNWFRSRVKAPVNEQSAFLTIYSA